MSGRARIAAALLVLAAACTGGEARGAARDGGDAAALDVGARDAPGVGRDGAVRADAAALDVFARDAPGVGDAEPRVSVHVLSKERPQALRFRAPDGRTIALRAEGDRVRGPGGARDRLELPDARWTVETPGGVRRRYEGAATVVARAGVLAPVIRMELERYVSAVVAAETEPGTPSAALEAQAIVVRSYALASRGRHAMEPGAALCDLAHCQVLRGEGRTAHHAAARAAARATRGRVLLLPDGRIAAATFHASCGGHTADPVAAFGGADGTGARAAPDPGCEADRWRASLPRALVQAAVEDALGAEARLGELLVERGRGGRIDLVRAPRTGRRISGEAFARALDRAAGWGAIRSAWTSFRAEGGTVRFEGRGLGHGVGLCQAGARRLAEAGLGAGAILGRYFHASVGPRPAAADAAAGGADAARAPAPAGAASAAGGRSADRAPGAGPARR